MTSITDVIVACATPIGTAGVAVIRVSGHGARDMVAHCVPAAQNITPRYVALSPFYYPHTTTLLDQVCCIYFKGPRSYTGEDCVEIQCHSSVYVIKEVLASMQQLGARLAEPGEFTKRAVVNGKLALTQAEAVIDLIHSETKLQHVVSLNRVEGKFFKHMQQFRSQFMALLEQLEGSIDFPDEVPAIDRKETVATMNSCQADITRIIQLQDLGKAIETGVHVVFVGAPNVGKSSLFNACLGQERALVADQAGTTRDYITEKIIYHDLPFHLYDTAGIRTDADVIEYMGMQHVEGLINKADLILWVGDQQKGLDAEDRAVLDKLKNKKNVACVWNKADAVGSVVCDQVSTVPFQPLFELRCSSFNEAHITELKQLCWQASTGTYTPSDLEWLCTVRQQAGMAQLSESVAALLAALEEEQYDDIVTIVCRRCVESCSDVIGDSLSEEMLDGVFSRFCVGK